MLVLRKNIRFTSWLMVGVLSISSSLAHATSTCENVFNNLPEFEQRYAEAAPGVNITYRHVHTDKREFTVEEVLGKTDDLLLGIAPFGHAYLVNGKVRVDGTLLGQKTTVHDHMAELETGIVIKVKKTSLNNDVLKKMDDTYGISCAKTACEAMAKAGDLYIGDNKSKYYSPYEMAQAIFKNGLRDGAGNVVPFEIYYIGKFEFENTMRRVRQSSKTLRDEAVVKYGVVATGLVLTGTVLAVVLMSKNDDSKKQKAQH
ncbi:hypothetical protein B9G69_017425 [Bdellovibrio sp. SKB1291214]|uniref:hypothetical protein n=1 Tax=Bdellovibrio sp. SKB1291214 TaxID=1732569 RepID=UPI001130F7D9|nr:hypothetical protein [Bdellovibrio sp. SKB1291214]UYL08827.1 hypothetical protein B9G69_017425 [Bdellovibrio sp. SKB1291214]